MVDIFISHYDIYHNIAQLYSEFCISFQETTAVVRNIGL